MQLSTGLLSECHRMLLPGGRLVIHTSPTKSAIDLCRSIKAVTLGRLDLYSRLVNPDYEFLHIRYHSQKSLRDALLKRSLYPVVWGEFQYLAGTKLEAVARKLKMDTLSDQLWCVAFKDPGLATQRVKTPYLDMTDLPSELDLGKCSDLFLGPGVLRARGGEVQVDGKVCKHLPQRPRGLPQPGAGASRILP